MPETPAIPPVLDFRSCTLILATLLTHCDSSGTPPTLRQSVVWGSWVKGHVA